MNLESILMKMREEETKFVRFELTDMYGVARSKTVPANLFEEFTCNGMGFTAQEIVGTGVLGDSIKGTGYGVENGFFDCSVFPDLGTFYVLPWLKGTARILVEPTMHGTPFLAHPRVLARKQLERLEALGISLLVAHEHEFRIFNKDNLRLFSEDSSGKSTIRNTPIHGLLEQILESLPLVGVKFETMHSESGPGAMEITYKPAFGIRSADNAHTFKTSVKEIALLNGYVASFMSSPLQDGYTNSCHFCHSLWDIKTGATLLFDKHGNYELSAVGQQWIAGLLAHAQATAVLMAPTVNCQESDHSLGLFPKNATWGLDNRTCLIRLKVKGDKGTYLEHRSGSSACNPYIALAAVVAAGIDGIINKMELPPPVAGSAYEDENVLPETAKLPTSMEDAIQALLDDKVICDALGEDFIKCFTVVKRHEVNMAREAAAKEDKNWQFKNFFYYL